MFVQTIEEEIEINLHVSTYYLEVNVWMVQKLMKKDSRFFLKRESGSALQVREVLKSSKVRLDVDNIKLCGA